LPTAAKSKQKMPLANYVLHPIICEGKSKASASPTISLVVPPLLFPLLKFKDKMAYSWEKWRGR
jgi:hypothetical protein